VAQQVDEVGRLEALAIEQRSRNIFGSFLG
jgi:hypothetical protein